MTPLSKESRLVQNPALGATLLWRFVSAFQSSHQQGDYPPLQLLYLVLPMTLHAETCDMIRATQKGSGLSTFADRFTRSDANKTDILLAIDNRVIAWRELTRASLAIALRCRLLTIAPDTGKVVAIVHTQSSAIPPSVNHLLSAAEKLGAWFSGLTLFEIATSLKVHL